MNKYKGFDGLLSDCLGSVESIVIEGQELGVYRTVHSYSDLREEFPNDFEKFDFVGVYNFMEMFYEYIGYESSFISDVSSFNDVTGDITVDLELLSKKIFD
ncbi:hypothetical protein [Staphylococcus equorum]|uniref:hypothetical protein n=1 Tax=Staphylococcus equorum TaxID=246432 RepID=UPI0008534A21|nr:hypothetical protein [Staphylococcus equorum]OEL08254.1 hypothetical protein AST04_08700 [Staphylococcus equorum]